MPSFAGFDPKTLLTTTVKAKLDTSIPPIPLDETDEFPAMCKKVDTRVITSKKSNTFGEQYVSLDTEWEILDERVKHVTHMEHPTARYSFILEVDPVNGLAIGEAKNVKLGKLLAACGIKAKEWSLSMIQGQTAYVKIKHRPDEDDDSIIYNEISRVTAEPKRRNGH
jgi:hypothetical protein